MVLLFSCQSAGSKSSSVHLAKHRPPECHWDALGCLVHWELLLPACCQCKPCLVPPCCCQALPQEPRKAECFGFGLGFRSSCRGLDTPRSASSARRRTAGAKGRQVLDLNWHLPHPSSLCFLLWNHRNPAGDLYQEMSPCRPLCP